MGVANLIMLFLGGVLIVFGYLRAREPWARYQALREQDANIARYEAWRGGLRDEGTTGASVAMQVLRRQVREGAIAIGTGIIFVIAGFALP